jgi:ATP-dependent RNA helicase DDX5/DBP2
MYGQRTNNYSSRGGSGGGDRGGYNSYRGGGNNGYQGTGGNDPNMQRLRAKQNEEIILKKVVWTSANMRPFDKNFYRESSAIRNRSQSELNHFLQKNQVKIVGDSFVKPLMTFGDLTLPDSIGDCIRKANYTTPTPIQSLCWPTLISGHDLVGIAQTGSGKTLGFIIPILVHILNNQRYIRSVRDEPNGPVALVLAPTRELAQQIQKVAEEFGNQAGIRDIVIYGGASKGGQASQIRRGADIYIATPGRLLDFLKEGTVSLSRCTFLVLDEADRMLDMGFEPQIRKIIEQIRPDRQTAMFSATWPKEVRKLAEDFISNYIHASIGSSELQANPNIKQIIEVLQEFEKENRLKAILADIMAFRDSKAIIFAETKKKVDAYSKFIRELGYHCLCIHGDKKQQEREWVLSGKLINFIFLSSFIFNF